MICTPEEAKNYICWRDGTPCEGKLCMAWVERHQSVYRPNGKSAMSSTFPKTGDGHCGLVEQI